MSKSKGKGVGDLKDDENAVAAQKSAQTVDSTEQVMEDARDFVIRS